MLFRVIFFKVLEKVNGCFSAVDPLTYKISMAKDLGILDDL